MGYDVIDVETTQKLHILPKKSEVNLVCIVCVHIAENSSRKAWMQVDEPLNEIDSGIVLLCNDGENPCSHKGDDINPADLVTCCIGHFRDLIARCNEVE